MTEHAALDTPILLLIFNRPETTLRVMDSVRAARPTKLFIAADGPRTDRADEVARCEAARQAATSVDWPCEIHRLYRDHNLGCAVSVSTAITWFFEGVEQGIILEDDCVAGRSFYRFCHELLAYHREETRIMHIGGTSFQYGRRRGPYSYYYSRFVNIWGWASWRRAWRHYDFTLRPTWKLQDTWDTQWQLSMEKAGGLAIVPNVNLVKNVGFGLGATHTKGMEPGAYLEAEEMQFPLTHPRSLRAVWAADVFTYYAHHRLVRYHRLVWMYWLRDKLYTVLKPLKRSLYGWGARMWSTLRGRSRP